MPRSQDGFTLIEVMAASAVLSAVVLCSVRSWAIVDQVSLDLQLRQKAVFALNGEAERLSKLYTAGGFSSPGAKVGGPGTLQTVSGSFYVAITGITGSSTRLVYATTTTGPTFDTASVSDFASPTSSDNALWVYGTGTTMQNFVWLDRSRSIMARLSWVACPLSASSGSASNTAAVCWGSTASRPMAGLCYAYDGSTGGTSCSLVTLILDYPFRLSNNVPVAESQLAGSHLTPTTLTLGTIVGRRL